jgi:hypothetical protein
MIELFFCSESLVDIDVAANKVIQQRHTQQGKFYYSILKNQKKMLNY